MHYGGCKCGQPLEAASPSLRGESGRSHPPENLSHPLVPVSQFEGWEGGRIWAKWIKKGEAWEGDGTEQGLERNIRGLFVKVALLIFYTRLQSTFPVPLIPTKLLLGLG